MEKQKLLFHQARLSNRGVAEMVLLHISASKGVPSEMVMKTLELGIAILRGGNIDIQLVIIPHFRNRSQCNCQMVSFRLVHLGNAQSLEGEERRRLLHFDRWADELMQRPRFGRIRTEHEGRRYCGIDFIEIARFAQRFYIVHLRDLFLLLTQSLLASNAN